LPDSIRLSSVTVTCPDPAGPAAFYAHITGGQNTFSNRAWTTLEGPGAGRRRHPVPVRPNADHCLAFAEPAGHPFCLTTLEEMG
jgi:hypothetical protein